MKNDYKDFFLNTDNKKNLTLAVTSTAWTSEQKCLPNSVPSLTLTLVTCNLGLSSEVLRMFSKKVLVSSGVMSSLEEAMVLMACNTEL